MYAEVVLAKTSAFSDKIYHYSIPHSLEAQVQVGVQVLIPFGKRKTNGFVVGTVATSDVPGIKDLFAVTSSEPLFAEKQVELAKWISERYCSLFGAALKLILPPGGKLPTSNLKSASGGQNKSKTQNSKLETLKLTDEQEKALKAINNSIESKKTDKFLLYGVTGSGKTEIYLRATAKVLAQGRSVIVLVPEIGLTPQLVERFSERFGSQTALLHSHLTLKQRNQEWQRIKAGEAKIVLGARSAVFAPIKDLGLVVIDEEYETSYKSEQSPRYHAREVADFLIKQHQAVLVLGSATPSVETYYQSEQAELKKLVLSKRIDDRPLPTVEIINMQEEKAYILSAKLRAELKQAFENKQQSILFINRRGFYTFIKCKSCGYVVECPHCSISLTYHAKDQKLRCHRCDYSVRPPSLCPRCNAQTVTYFGMGTQRIEKEVAAFLHGVRIMRYDRDAVTKRGSHETIFQTFAQGKADVLIGTQMVAKGLDVANVTLVGVVAADTGLHFPDFRAAEHTFQLLTQVAGRAGRHHLPGKVIIQTYTPDHYAIKAAANQDYDGFYQEEIKYRQELNYPPFAKLTNLIISGSKQEVVAKAAQEIAQKLRAETKEQVLGPTPAGIAKKRGRFYYHILLKGQNFNLKDIKAPRDIRVIVDVGPVGLV